MRKYNSILALFICLLLFLPITTNVFASENTVIEISNEEQFLEFAENCKFDNFSKDKCFMLTNDINLNHKEFDSIPIFCGVFDGNGYTVSGLSLSANYTYQGLFRHIETGATVKNLMVEGAVNPVGEKNFIGGIAGKNNGIIENCSFSGIVNGMNDVGGIAGLNGSNGIIMGSSISGAVYGESRIGGIVGNNSGTVLRCQNNAKINDMIEEHSFSFEEVTVHDLEVTNNIKEITDIGGIAGINVGIIENCQNLETIGYPHIGYNIGGIAGRQTGYINNCTNTALILGRKDVGGIVGQMEPYSVLFYSSEKLEKLRTELHTLQTMTNRFTGSGQSGVTELSDGFSELSKSVDESRKYTEDVLNQTESLINQNIDELNTISITISGALDRLVPISQNLSMASAILPETIDSIDEAVILISKSIDKLDGTSSEYDKITTELSKASSKFNSASESINAGINKISDALELAKNGGDILQIFELAVGASNDFIHATSSISSAMGHLKSASVRLGIIFNKLDNASVPMQRALDAIRDSLAYTKDISEYLEEASKDTTLLIEYLDDRPDIKFATTDDAYQNTKTLLSNSLTAVSSNVDTLNALVNKNMTELFSNLEDVNNQLFVVFDLLLDITEEVINTDISFQSEIDDISKYDTDQQTAGKVENSHNFGNIEGDINAGGISGSMSIDYGFDKEDDLITREHKLSKSTLKTRAIIRNCESVGNVTTKKDGAGGIVGNMNLGYVRDCVSGGKIVSLNGNYVGGIAGISDSLISSSWSKCELVGNAYVGGIAGSGYEVQNSYTMPKIIADGAYQGAIVGMMQEDGTIIHNFFVSNILGGIDSISYAEKAEPMNYDVLTSIEHLPDMFKNLTISFDINDIIVKEVEVNYGDKIEKSLFPEIPNDEDNYTQWDASEDDIIFFDKIIKAEYSPYVTTLESSNLRNENTPIILVEGKFKQEDILHIENKSIDSVTEEIWTITIPKDGNEHHLIRYLPNTQKKIDIMALENGTWNDVTTESDGDYIIFTVDGYNVQFKIVPVEQNIELIVILCLVIVGLIGIAKKRRHKSIILQKKSIAHTTV